FCTIFVMFSSCSNQFQKFKAPICVKERIIKPKLGHYKIEVYDSKGLQYQWVDIYLDGSTLSELHIAPIFGADSITIEGVVSDFVCNSFESLELYRYGCKTKSYKVKNKNANHFKIYTDFDCEIDINNDTAIYYMPSRGNIP
ncbi:MAG: hypothetical protein COB67_10610, partial [SAR324 cluster bacterium]